jgi:branched-chain amino acid aminotransferase
MSTLQIPASILKSCVFIDGEMVDTENARISVFDRGFLYGDSIFETLRTYNGRVFALAEHMARLEESAARVFIDLPISGDELEAEVERAVSRSGFPECYIRVMVTRGVGALGLDPKMAVSPTRVIIVTPLSLPPLSDYRDGICAITFEASRPGDASGAAGAKIGNYLIAVIANKKAREHGAKEALIVGPDGGVIEGATSNLFWLQDDLLYTVPIDAGILAGITRAHILAAAAALDLAVRMQTPSVPELCAADAVFISSSIREILPVIRIDEHVIAEARIHPTVRRLHDEFRKAAGAEPLGL